MSNRANARHRHAIAQEGKTGANETKKFREGPEGPRGIATAFGFEQERVIVARRFATNTAPAPAKAPAAAALDTQALIREANQHYQRAMQLQRQGDWAGYGEEVKKLGEVLNRLASAAPAGTK